MTKSFLLLDRHILTCHYNATDTMSKSDPDLNESNLMLSIY